MDRLVKDGGSSKGKMEAVRSKLAELKSGYNKGPGLSHQATALRRIPIYPDTAKALSSN